MVVGGGKGRAETGVEKFKLPATTGSCDNKNKKKTHRVNDKRQSYCICDTSAVFWAGKTEK